jgi:hypothetical protein
MTLEQILERGEDVSHKEIWRKRISCTGNSKFKRLWNRSMLEWGTAKGCMAEADGVRGKKQEVRTGRRWGTLNPFSEPWLSSEWHKKQLEAFDEKIYMITLVILAPRLTVVTILRLWRRVENMGLFRGYFNIPSKRRLWFRSVVMWRWW